MAAFWTETETSRLKALHAQGLTSAEIGAMLRRTKSSVISCVKRLRRQGVDLELRGSTPRPEPEEPYGADRRAAFACNAHLRDLRASGGRWASLAIPAERSCPLRSGPQPRSLAGSAAALCAES